MVAKKRKLVYWDNWHSWSIAIAFMQMCFKRCPQIVCCQFETSNSPCKTGLYEQKPFWVQQTNVRTHGARLNCTLGCNCILDRKWRPATMWQKQNGPSGSQTSKYTTHGWVFSCAIAVHMRIKCTLLYCLLYWLNRTLKIKCLSVLYLHALLCYVQFVSDLIIEKKKFRLKKNKYAFGFWLTVWLF